MPIIFIDSTMLPPPFISCLCKNKEMKIAKSTNTISFPSKPNEYLSKKKKPSWCSRLIKILRLQHPNSSKRVKLKKNQLTIVTKTGLFFFLSNSTTKRFHIFQDGTVAPKMRIWMHVTNVAMYMNQASIRSFVILCHQ